jgi:hypothetical protein
MDSMTDIARDLLAGKAYLRIIRDDETYYFDAAVKPYRALDVVESWSVGVDSDVRGTYGEWVLNWRRFSDGSIAMRIEAFSDSFEAMAAIPGWWEALRSVGPNASPADTFEALTALGFQDMTARVEAAR